MIVGVLQKFTHGIERAGRCTGFADKNVSHLSVLIGF